MLDQQQINSFRKWAIARGYNEAQISREIARKQQEVARVQAKSTKPTVRQGSTTQPVTQTQKKSVGGFIGNAARDLGENIKGLASLPGAVIQGVRNPSQLPEMGGNIVKGVIKDYTDLASNPVETAYESPVSTALNLLPFAGKISKIAKFGKGAKAVDAVSDASKAGNIATATEKIGSKITKAGEQVALRSLRPSPSQLTAFKKATGIDLAKFMADRDLAGDFTNAAKSRIETLMNGFDDIAVRSGRKITKGQIKSSFNPIIKELKGSKLSANKTKAAALEDELKGILDELDDTSDVSDITEVRRSADDLAKKFSQDPANADLYQLVRDGLQDAIRKRTDNIKINGRSLKEIGMEIHAFREFEKIASRQENLGRGSKLMGLTKSVMTGGGGATAGIPGAVAGFAASTVLDSPKVIGGISKVMQNLGERISGGAGKVEQVMNKTKGAIPGATLVGRQLDNEPEEEILPEEDFIEEDGEMEDFATDTASVSHPIFGEVTKQEILEQAFRSGLNGKQLDEIEAIYDRFAPEQEEEVQLTDAAITKISDTRSAIRDVQRLGEEISSSNLTGPLTGLRAKNPYDTDSRELQAEIDRVRQKVGKALEGGVLRKEDEEKYKKILPTMNDTKEVAIAKIEKLQKTLAEDLEDFVTIQSSYGKGRTGTQADEFLSAPVGPSVKKKSIEVKETEKAPEKNDKISQVVLGIGKFLDKITPTASASEGKGKVIEAKIEGETLKTRGYDEEGKYYEKSSDVYKDLGAMQQLGKVVEDMGKKLGLEEYKISEKFGFNSEEYSSELLNKFKEVESVSNSFKEKGYILDPDGVWRKPEKSVKSKEEDVKLVLKGVPEEGKKNAEKNVPLIEKALRDAGIYSREVLAYAMATTQHETANSFEPVNEGYYNDKKFGYEPGFTGKSEANKRKYGGGENYFGRGFVQLTHKENYKRIGKAIGVDLDKHPEKANDPEVAAKILAYYFKNKKIDRLVNEGKFTEARRLVNPDNKGGMIAETAQKYLKSFEE